MEQWGTSDGVTQDWDGRITQPLVDKILGEARGFPVIDLLISWGAEIVGEDGIRKHMHGHKAII